MVPRMPPGNRNNALVTDGVLTAVAVIVSLCVMVVMLVVCTLKRCGRKKKTKRVSGYINKNYDEVETSGSSVFVSESTPKVTKAPVKPKRSHSARGERNIQHTANYENVFLDVFRGNFSPHRAPSVPQESVSDASDIPFIDASREDITRSDEDMNKHRNNNVTVSVEQDRVLYEKNCDDVLENTTDTVVQDDVPSDLATDS